MLTLGAAVCLLVPAPAAAQRETRSVRLDPSALESPDTIRSAVLTARGTADTLVVQVPIAGIQPGALDALAELSRQVKQAGLRLHAAIAIGLAAAAGELPIARDHVVYTHPEWLMVPRDIAIDMLTLDHRRPDYLGRLSRWTRANTTRSAGLYVSPLQPDAVTYLAARLGDLVRRYGFDGVHLDAAAFPIDDFDYSRLALDTFRTQMRPTLSPAERARMDLVEAIDPFGYAEEFPDEWRRFRESRLAALVASLQNAVAAVLPSAVISSATPPGVVAAPVSAAAGSR